MTQGSPTGWTMIAVEDCDFAGIPIPKGARLHVAPDSKRPVVLIADLPPNYEAITALLCDKRLVQVTGSPAAMASLPASPPLQLVPSSSRQGPRHRLRVVRRRSALVPLSLVH